MDDGTHMCTRTFADSCSVRTRASCSRAQEVEEAQLASRKPFHVHRDQLRSKYQLESLVVVMGKKVAVLATSASELKGAPTGCWYEASVSVPSADPKHNYGYQMIVYDNYNLPGALSSVSPSPILC